MIKTPLISSCVDYVKELLEAYEDKLYYHNFEHALRTAKSVGELAEDAQLSSDTKEDLVIAAFFHDVGYIKNPKDHEEISKSIALKFLESRNISNEKRNRIAAYILATKDDWDGDDEIALLLKDAVMSGLASKKYLEHAEELRLEMNAISGSKITEEEWLIKNIDFMEKTDYVTNSAFNRYDKKKKKNLKKLYKMKKEKLSTITSSKTAQTQLKTSLRNHINLSTIADNKANMMLSVNTIVITVGLPLMNNHIFENKLYLIPIVIIAISSIISMTFATLSTRPIKMEGYTDLSMIPKKKTNLFFFGNFYNMNFDDYEVGIRKVISDDEILENSIARDLFFLGKSLGKKFNYLRICYNVFLIGMMLTAITYVFVSMVIEV